MASRLPTEAAQPTKPADTTAFPNEVRPEDELIELESMPYDSIPLPPDVGRDVELIETDGEPLDSDWQRLAMTLLLETIKQRFRERQDFYTGGNMFIYYEERGTGRRRFKGPDFFFVKGTSRTPIRPYWAVYHEGGLYPNAIIELLSRSTAQEDLTTKKDVYEKQFRTPDYFCYDPRTLRLQGWRLNKRRRYKALVPNERGWLWSEELGLWLGTWTGKYQGEEATWLRFYDSEYRLVFTASEAEQQSAEAERQRAETERQRAETERRRAETERQRAEATAAELAQLKALLASKGLLPEAAEDADK